MSDGPHRCLPMNRSWKEAARRADKAAYSPEEVSNSAASALAKDWNKGVSPALIRALEEWFGGGEQMSFFSASSEALNDLRPMVTGSPLSSLVLDHAEQVAADGGYGENGLETAIANASSEWACGAARQIEEIYIRESTSRRAAGVRQRIEAGVAQISFRNIARQVIENGKPLTLREQPKLTGLDDGVCF